MRRAPGVGMARTRCGPGSGVFFATRRSSNGPSYCRPVAAQGRTTMRSGADFAELRQDALELHTMGQCSSPYVPVIGFSGTEKGFIQDPKRGPLPPSLGRIRAFAISSSKLRAVVRLTVERPGWIHLDWDDQNLVSLYIPRSRILHVSALGTIKSCFGCTTAVVPSQVGAYC